MPTPAYGLAFRHAFLRRANAAGPAGRGGRPFRRRAVAGRRQEMVTDDDGRRQRMTSLRRARGGREWAANRLEIQGKTAK